MYSNYCPPPPDKPYGSLTGDQFLFNLQKDEYEEHNVIANNEDKAEALWNLIVEQMNSDSYVPMQSNEEYNASWPQYHDGAWAPWLD